MTDQELLIEASSLLARITPAQRLKLAEMARSFGEPAGAMDKVLIDSPSRARSFEEMFPNANRLRG